MPFAPHRYKRRNPTPSTREDQHDHALHQGPRIHPRRGRHRHRRHHRLRPGAARRRRLRRAPEVGKAVAKGGEAAVVESVKAASESMRRSPARSSRSTASSRRARRGQRGPGRPGLVPEARSCQPAELDGLLTEEQYQEFVKSIVSAPLSPGRRALVRRWNDRDALSSPHRRRPQRDAGARSASPTSTPCSPTCPPDELPEGAARPAAPQGRARGGAHPRPHGGAERRGRRRCRSSSARAPTSTMCRRRSIT